MKRIMILLLIVTSSYAEKVARQSIFVKPLSERELADWVKYQPFGGFAGVPEKLFAIKDFRPGVVRAKALLDSKKPILFSFITSEITDGVKIHNYSPLFGWYLASLGKKQGRELAIWLPDLMNKDRETLNKAIVFLVKKLFEQEITVNGEDEEFLDALIEKFRKSEVKVMPSVLVEDPIEKELKYIAERLSD